MTRADPSENARTSFADFSPVAHVIARWRHNRLVRQDPERSQAGTVSPLHPVSS